MFLFPLLYIPLLPLRDNQAVLKLATALRSVENTFLARESEIFSSSIRPRDPDDPRDPGRIRASQTFPYAKAPDVRGVLLFPVPPRRLRQRYARAAAARQDGSQSDHFTVQVRLKELQPMQTTVSQLLI